MIPELLSDLGFSENEVKVILCLVQQRTCAAGMIAKRTSLKRPTVYSILLNLEIRGLVTKIAKKGVSSFTLVDPQTFQNTLSSFELASFEKRRKAMEGIRSHLEQAAVADPKRVGEFELSVLDHNPVFTLQDNMLNAGDFDSVFDPAIVMATPESMKVCKKFLNTTAASRPKIRELIPPGEGAEWYVPLIKNPNHKVRLLPKGTKSPSDIILTNGVVCIMNYATPIQGLRIKQESFYTSLKSWFETMWSQSKEAE